MKTAKPKILLGLLADSHKTGPTGKVDAYGIFDKVFIWATPATREHSLVIRVSNLRSGQNSFDVIFETPSKKRVEVAAGNLNSETTSDETGISAIRIPLAFSEIGQHKLGIGFVDGSERSRFWIPLYVAELPWPPLPTGDELASLLKDPLSIKVVRAEISCPKCNTKHTFESYLDLGAKPSRGAKLFPASGRYKCLKCSSVIELRDIEGQLRSHLGKPAQRGGE